MVIFEEDYLLQTIVALDQRDVLDNHLASSDFVSTFSATLVRSVIPANLDQEAIETFLMALPDIILDFLDKLLFSGVDICTQFAETVWQKRRTRDSTIITCEDFIETLPWYSWLVGSLQRIFSLSGTRDWPMSDIASRVGQFLPRTQAYDSDMIDGYGEVTVHSARFSVDWDLRSYLEIYDGRFEKRIDQFITVTGTLQDGQALTPAKYMRQTWPSGGDCLLTLLKKLTLTPGARAPIQVSETTERSTKTTVSGSISGSSLVIYVRGIREAIISVAQQLCWLGAALRTSLGTPKSICCWPVVRKTGVFWGHISFEIKFEINKRSTQLEVLNGQCWHHFFDEPAVAYRFPILRRDVQNAGLEAPLNLLGRLVPSRWVTTFDGKVYIKGHSSILVPTNVVGNTVVWHLVLNDHGRYISYVDPQIEAIPGLYPEIVDCNLGSFRHIVGWCSAVKSLTGSYPANYATDWSGLDKVDKECGLAGVTVSRGIAIADLEGPTGAYSRTFDPDLGDYLRRLQSLSRRYVVFYDVGNRRGWLVDGASALLHLVRASLEFSSAEDLTGEFIFKPIQLQEAPTRMRGRSASMEILRSPQNLRLRLYRKMRETFLDRVEEIYHVLEKISAYYLRAKLLRQERVGGDRYLLRALEGFDFMDLAGDTNHFSARMADPSISLPRWAGLAESLNAPILFSREFGELLEPCSKLNVCSSWSIVPLGKDYLAVRVEDITEIMRRKGNSRGSPWRVVESIYWHMPDKMFENCGQLCYESRESCNHAQVLVWKEETGERDGKINSPTVLESQGAVIFDGSPLQSALSSLEATLAPSSTGSQSPVNDSGISVSYSPKTGSDPTITSIVTRKRPVSALIAPGDTGKRPCYRPSPIANETCQQGAVTEAKVPDPVEAFLDFGTSRKSIGPSSADYTVGWICALQIELDAAQRLFDRVHNRGFGHGRDCNLYTLGQIGNLNVVLICLPKGQYGTNSAAVAATRMINRFPKSEIGLMVGIGGGLPNAKNDVRLGDVVVGTGVVQYDLGKFTKDGFITTGTLKAPPEKLLHVLNYMPLHGSSITGQLEIDYPASYPHVGGYTCETCDRKQTVQRSILRDSTTPHVFYGTIASGNSVIKDSRTRETLIEKHGVVCCEMEAAGVMNTAFPCPVIRGISDYADSHKNDIWIPYAAAAAAQYARDLLLAMPADIALSDTVS
ncbi:hypothetical protein BJX65DRAFT_300118 [Aspergillus insuetus]